MKITKYPQSHFVIESGSTKIMIDPGTLSFQKYSPEDFRDLNAVLITHTHPDHLDMTAVKQIASEIPVYGNGDVVSQLEEGDVVVTKVEHDREFEVGQVSIRPVDIPHCKLLYCSAEKKTLKAPEISRDKKCKVHPALIPETTDGPPNTGFIINDVFFHPGDGINPQDFQIYSAAIPINGPTIEFEDAWSLSDSLKAKKIIPMHYTHPTFIADPKEFASYGKGDTKVIILEDGQPTEIKES